MTKLELLALAVKLHDFESWLCTRLNDDRTIEKAHLIIGALVLIIRFEAENTP